MTPKDKALQLIGRFAFEIGLSKTKCPINCAIIAVEEILSVEMFSNIDKDYWQEVKQELLKLK